MHYAMNVTLLNKKLSALWRMQDTKLKGDSDGKSCTHN